VAIILKRRLAQYHKGLAGDKKRNPYYHYIGGCKSKPLFIKGWRGHVNPYHYYVGGSKKPLKTEKPLNAAYEVGKNIAK